MERRKHGVRVLTPQQKSTRALLRLAIAENSGLPNLVLRLLSLLLNPAKQTSSSTVDVDAANITPDSKHGDESREEPAVGPVSVTAVDGISEPTLENVGAAEPSYLASGQAFFTGLESTESEAEPPNTNQITACDQNRQQTSCDTAQVTKCDSTLAVHTAPEDEHNQVTAGSSESCPVCRDPACEEHVPERDVVM